MVLLSLLILLLLPDYKIIDPVIFSQLKITTSRHKREREREGGRERERERERGRERGGEREEREREREGEREETYHTLNLNTSPKFGLTVRL